MPIKIAPETRTRLIASLKRYAAENLDEELGDLKAGLLLDYCLTEIGPAVYNQAIADAQAYFSDRVADLEGVCHEEEYTFLEAAKGLEVMTLLRHLLAITVLPFTVAVVVPVWIARRNA